jgi:replicative DNA helicase
MEFEHILIKKILTDGEFFSKTMFALEPKYFTSQGCQSILSLIKQYYAEYTTCPTMTEIVAQIKNVPNIELRKIIAVDAQQINSVDSIENNEFMFAETVTFIKDSVFMEALIMGSDALQDKDEDKKLRAKALMEEMSKITLGDSDLGLDFDDIEAMIRYYQDKLIGVMTQHPELNKRLGTGFLPGTLSIIMAASGIGKSLLMTDLISGQIAKGKNVLLVSMEMEDKEIMKRVHANVLNLPINGLKDLDPEVIRQAHEKFKASNNGQPIGQLFVKDYPNGTFSPMMLDALLDSYKIEKGIEFDIVYLDYLGIMKSDLITPNAGLYSYVKSIVEEVRSIAKKRKIPIVSASQLNRSAVNNTDARKDSVSDSSGTVQTADFILFLLQNEKMKEEKLITAKCTKNRFTGRTDTWNMNVDYEHMRFTDSVVQGMGITDKEASSMILEQQFEDFKKVDAHDKKLNVELNEELDIAKILNL